jgi:hypothetical protein
MPKLLIFSLLVFILGSNSSSAQTSVVDSIKKVAIKDAKKFKLNSAEVKQVKRGSITNKSDLFKPSAANTNQSQLLTDSTYVSAFRNAAYQRVIKSRTSAHYILLGIEITAATLLAVTLIALGVASK